jgi:hypothetical protein
MQNLLFVQIEFDWNGIFYFDIIYFIEIFSIISSATDQDENLKKYIQSRSHCLDIFEEYITTLKRQHGIIRNAASDPPIFDPGVSVSHHQTISSNDYEYILLDNRTTN